MRFCRGRRLPCWFFFLSFYRSCRRRRQWRRRFCFFTFSFFFFSLREKEEAKTKTHRSSRVLLFVFFFFLKREKHAPVCSPFSPPSKTTRERHTNKKWRASLCECSRSPSSPSPPLPLRPRRPRSRRRAPSTTPSSPTTSSPTTSTGSRWVTAFSCGCEIGIERGGVETGTKSNEEWRFFFFARQANQQQQQKQAEACVRRKKKQKNNATVMRLFLTFCLIFVFSTRGTMRWKRVLSSRGEEWSFEHGNWAPKRATKREMHFCVVEEKKTCTRCERFFLWQIQ